MKSINLNQAHQVEKAKLNHALDKLKLRRPPPTKSTSASHLPKSHHIFTSVRIEIPKFGVPNILLRSPLFGIANSGNSRIGDRDLASYGGTSISVDGPQFTQTHLDVLMAVLQIYWRQSENTRRSLNINAILKELKRGTSGRHRRELKMQMKLLTTTRVLIVNRHGSTIFRGSLLLNEQKNTALDEFSIAVPFEFGNLFREGYTRIDLIERQRLKKDRLAKWLHMFYSSHAKPFALKVSTLYRLSGGTQKDKSGYKRLLRSALQKLVDERLLKTFEIDESDLVKVKRFPSASQARHLNRRRKSI